MRNKKIVTVSTIIIILCIVYMFNAFAHSGRTDSSGGHWNRSTGTYHYHCGGYPAHSHSGGVCPYKTSSSSKTKKSTADEIIEKFNGISTESSSSNSSSPYSARVERYNTGYKAGYQKGYDEGYDKGYEEGYDKQSVILIVVLLITIIVIIIVEFIKKRRK